jgi:hypothetical protein
MALSLGVKQPGLEADDSPLVPTSRMHGAISALPQYAFVAWCSVKSRTTLLLPLQYFCNMVLPFGLFFSL